MAKIMNEYYVNVKVCMSIVGSLSSQHEPRQVDREERPDVDQLYMTFLQATTGGGGWPMSVCEFKACLDVRGSCSKSLAGLTPDLHPFFAGVWAHFTEVGPLILTQSHRRTFLQGTSDKYS